MTDGESRISDADYDSLVRELRRAGGFLQRRPSVETLAWVAASMGRSSRVVGFRRLRGGVWSAVHRVTVERRGVRTFVVLRQYPGGFGLDADLKKEIANLGVVAGSGLPVPEVLATDVAGASHMVAGDRNDAFLDAVVGFLDRQNSGQPAKVGRNAP